MFKRQPPKMLQQPSVWVLAWVSIFISDVFACTFPDSLVMKGEDPPWYSHVMADKSRGVAYYIRRSVMEIHFQDSDRKHTRWKCAMAYEGKLLLKRQDHHANNFYKCAKIMVRSPSVVQFLWSHEIRIFDIDLCRDENLKVDPWPLIRFETLHQDYNQCTFSGGYNMKITDSILGSNGCNKMHRPMRLEVECLGGEGATFNFGSRNCIPDIKMYLTQRTVCVANWQDSKNYYTILRRNEDEDIWCMVMPRYQPNSFKAFLYSDLVCPLDRKELGPFGFDGQLKFFTLDLQKQIFPTLCEDEYPQCSDVTCNAYVEKECQKSCHVCNASHPLPKCDFPRRYRGSWFQTSSDGYRDVRIGDSDFSVDGVGNFQCTAFPDSPSRKSKYFATVSLYENGCRPRYTCIKLKRVGPSVLQYTLGQSYTWPSLEKDFGKEICSKDRFAPDPSPVDDLYRSEAGKPIIGHQPNVKAVNCNVSAVLTIGAELPQGYVCSGSVYQHCEDPTMLRMTFDSCTGLIATNSDYRCLSNFHGNDWERILLLQNVNDARDSICFVFNDYNENMAYVMVAGQCDQNSFTYATENIRKPRLIINYREENIACISVPRAPPTSATRKTTPAPGWSAKGHALESYKNRTHADQGRQRSPSSSVVVTISNIDDSGRALHGSHGKGIPKAKSSISNEAGNSDLHNSSKDCSSSVLGSLLLLALSSVFVTLSR